MSLPAPGQSPLGVFIQSPLGVRGSGLVQLGSILYRLARWSNTPGAPWYLETIDMSSWTRQAPPIHMDTLEGAQLSFQRFAVASPPANTCVFWYDFQDGLARGFNADGSEQFNTPAAVSGYTVQTSSVAVVPNATGGASGVLLLSSSDEKAGALRSIDLTTGLQDGFNQFINSSRFVYPAGVAAVDGKIYVIILEEIVGNEYEMYIKVFDAQLQQESETFIETFDTFDELRIQPLNWGDFGSGTPEELVTTRMLTATFRIGGARSWILPGLVEDTSVFRQGAGNAGAAIEGLVPTPLDDEQNPGKFYINPSYNLPNLQVIDAQTFFTIGEWRVNGTDNAFGSAHYGQLPVSQLAPLSIVFVPDRVIAAESAGGDPYTEQLELTTVEPAASWFFSDRNPPAGMTIDAATGEVLWPAPVAGTYQIEAQCVTTLVRGDRESWEIIVQDDAPQITPLSDDSGTAGVAYFRSTSVSAGDAPIVWSLDEAPGGMTIRPIGGLNGFIEWDNPVVGVHLVTVRATNAVDFDAESFNLTIS